MLLLPLLALAQTAMAIKPIRYPSCDLVAQNSLEAKTGGTVTDPRQAHILMRANILQADLGTAQKAGLLSRNRADRLFDKVQMIRVETNELTRKQGLFSDGERASFDRELDGIAMKFCPSGALKKMPGGSGE